MLCAFCQEEIPLPKRPKGNGRPSLFCSAVCRVKGWRKGVTATSLGMGRVGPIPLAPITCALCGKTVMRRPDRAKRMQHCSYACAKRGRAPDVPRPALNASFGHWLAGLTDGEGTFVLTRSSAVFRIQLRADDRSVLETIQLAIRFGHLYDSSRKLRNNEHPTSMFTTNSLKEGL